MSDKLLPAAQAAFDRLSAARGAQERTRLKAIDTTAADGSGGERDPAQVRKAARMFEAVFVRQLLKTMRDTVPYEDEEGESFSRDTVNEMFDDALADKTAGGLGLAAVIERELGGAASTPAPSTELRRTRGVPQSYAKAVFAAHTGSTTGVRGSAPDLLAGLMGPGGLPVVGELSSDYGWREHPIDGHRKFHEGVDIAAPEGTPIRAVGNGVVVRAGRMGSYGNVVEVRHEDGTVARYAHAHELHVRKGQSVERGETLAGVGQTGAATGNHVHFEVLRDGKAIDPLRYLSDRTRAPEVARLVKDRG